MTPAHKRAVMGNLATSLLGRGRIQTTIAKAKELRGVVERIITFAKRGDLHSRRLVARTIKNDSVVKKLFAEIAPGFKDRPGGYTRVLRLGQRRGDGAELSIIELLGYVPKEKPKKTQKKKKQEEKPAEEKEKAAAEAA